MATSNYCRSPQCSNLAIFTKAKELSKLIILSIQTAPKKFRFSLVARFQDLGLQLVGHLYRANEVFVNLKLLNEIDRIVNDF